MWIIVTLPRTAPITPAAAGYDRIRAVEVDEREPPRDVFAVASFGQAASVMGYPKWPTYGGQPADDPA
jgi:hypothetical protein